MSKAILEYGQFTTMIELPEPRQIISIIKPNEALSIIPLSEQMEVAATISHRLEFQVERQLTDDIWLYKFLREA